MNNLESLPKNLSPLILSILEAVDPQKLVKSVLNIRADTLEVCGKSFEISDDQHICVIGLGKASFAMMQGFLELYQESPIGKFRGLVISKAGHSCTDIPSNVEVILSGHPVPTENSVLAAKAAFKMVSNLSPKDLCVYLISGGGSSLAVFPVFPLTLQDIQEVNQRLLSCGAAIEEMNCVRKAFDQFKGGGLSRKAFSAHQVSLILSDVIGDPMDVIASGPTYPDIVPADRLQSIIQKYRLWDSLPRKIQCYVNSMYEKQYDEKMKNDAAIYNQSAWHILANNRTAVNAAADFLKSMGYVVDIIPRPLLGSVEEAGVTIKQKIKELPLHQNEKKAVLWGGETTVALSQKIGKGGRNLELALSLVDTLADHHQLSLFTFATDGDDGNSGAAGAYITGETRRLLLKKGISISSGLKEHDSFSVLNLVGSALVTGSTGTNVNDVTILFTSPVG